MHNSWRWLAVLGSLFAMGAACCDEDDQADDDFYGSMSHSPVGASAAGDSAKGGRSAGDGGTGVNVRTALDLSRGRDGGAKLIPGGDLSRSRGYRYAHPGARACPVTVPMGVEASARWRAIACRAAPLMTA